MTYQDRLGGHGASSMSMEPAMAYEMAKRAGIERIAEMARRFGLGSAADLPIPALKDGLIPDKAWKQTRYKESWQVGDSLNSAIGQGYVLSTPLQLAVMTARLASGKGVHPRLIRARGGVPVPIAEPSDLNVSAHSLALVRQGMFDVVNGRRGTARKARIAEQSMLMAGKTGTSQVRNITKTERALGVTRNEDLPWERRDHALFVCYAPFDNPKYAVSVVVEHGGGGSTAAAPIARDMMMRALYGPEVPLRAYPPDQRPERALPEPSPRPEVDEPRIRT